MKRLKKTISKKSVLLFLCLINLITLQAQVNKTINITIPGSLTSTLSQEEKNTITSLTVTGTIDARDFKALRDEMPHLAVIDMGNARIEGYEGSEGTTTYTWSYPENHIPQYAFHNDNNVFYESPLTSFIIPTTATFIDEFAFFACKQLHTIDIPSGIESIARNSFSYCSGLVSLNISEGVTHIGESAFNECINLASVTIPGSMVLIDKSAFQSCFNLNSLTISNGVLIIEESAFQYCKKLSSVILPTSLTEISQYSFYGCQSLSSVTIPSSIKYIESHAFSNCDQLNAITIPSSVISIGESAFSNSGIFSIVIPGSVKTIENNLFSQCMNLNTVELSEGIVSIGDFAFNNCSQLGSVIIPSSVKSIGAASFSNCQNLSSVVIPEGIVNIGRSAFGSCSGLTSVNIPSSVLSIGTDAFGGCNGLTSIKVGFSEPLDLTFSQNVFYLVEKATCELQVPYGTKESFAAAYQWNDFATITESTVVFNLSANRVTVAAVEASTGMVEITSDKAWTVTSNASWLTLNTLTGTGNGTLTMTAAANPSLGSRMAQIIVSIEGGASQTITLLQEAKEMIFNVTPGQLTTILTEAEKASVTKLILTGSIDARDFRIMRDEMPLLAYVDLTNVIIEAYTGNEGTLRYSTYWYGANQVPPWAFFNIANWDPNINLTTFIYPTTAVSVGKEAFMYCENLTSANLPPTMQSIGENAFRYCPKLQTVLIPEGVQIIGASAFEYCPSLKSVTIPSTVKSIERLTFDYCQSLKTLTLSEGIQSIGAGAFSRCISLNSVTIPSSILSIGENAFEGCEKLSQITLSEGVTSIGQSAFNNCISLGSVTIPSSVRLLDIRAFYNCSALTSIKAGHSIPLDLTHSPGVFEGVNKTSCNLTVPYESKSLYTQAVQWKDFFTINENNIGFTLSATDVSLIDTTGNKATVTINGNIEWTASSNQPWLTVTPGAGEAVDAMEIIASANPFATPRSASIVVTAISGDQIITQTIAVTQGSRSPVFEVTPGALSSILTNEEKNSIAKLILTGTIDARDFRTMRDAIPNLKIIDLSKVTIAAYAGSLGTVYMSMINYPANEIPTYAFHKPNGGKNTLTTFMYPSSATSIGENAFYECNGLTSVVIPSTIHSIKKNAFNNCQNLSTLIISEGVNTIGESAFSGCNSLPSIIIPLSTDSIGSYAFFRNGNLKTVSIHSANGIIGPYAFYNCDQIISLTLSEGVRSIGESAFSNCTGLTSINIPSSVSSIGKYAFNYCYSITSAILAEGVKTIGEYAFNECSSLVSATIPSSVVSIGGFAFYNCRALDSQVVPPSLTFLGNSAFYNCSLLKSVVIPSTLDSIRSNTFVNCLNLATLTISEGVKSIGREAFKSCISLSELVIPSTVKTIGNSAFFNCEKLSSLTISEGVNVIDNGAFNHCSSLTAVEIPTSVSSIGTYAFEACNLLKSLTLSEGLASIGEAAFLHTLIDTLILPSTITSMGGYAFNNCDNLSSLTLTKGMTVVGKSAFSGCKKLETIFIPSSITYIGGLAFAGCTSLTSVKVEREVPLDLSLTPYIFSYVNKSTCKLYVPYGSKGLYATADQWKDFMIIVEFGGPIVNPAIIVDKGASDQRFDLKTIFKDENVTGFTLTSNSNEQVVISSISGTELTLNFSSETIGISDIEITAISNGKEVKALFKVEVKLPTGINSREEDLELKIYPNPTRGEVNVKIAAAKGNQYFVYDGTGRIVYQSFLKNEEETFNLNGNPSGTYYLKMEGKTKDVYKIVLE